MFSVENVNNMGAYIEEIKMTPKPFQREYW